MLTLRDNAEGLIELIEMQPVVLATFGRRAVAEDFLAWYREVRQAGQPAPAPAPEAEPEEALAEEADVPPAPPQPAPADEGPRVQLPAVVPQQPKPRIAPKPRPAALSDEARDAAIDRITAGETIIGVAQDIGISWTQLRAIWAAHKQRLQRHIATGGPEACAVCGKAFTPSLTNPTTCARCSRD